MSDELRIKIVLDDGSVRDGFLGIEKQAENAAKKVGSSFDKKGSGLDGLTQGLNAASGGFSSIAGYVSSSLGPIVSFGIAAAVAATATFKMALAGEQVNAVNAQFANLASSAGLSAERFGESIIKATQGLIDDEDALQIATKGIVSLGNQASKLPAILDAARGVSRALGKDFKSTFEDLSAFVENGNARVLRQFGIVLDLEKAYTKAAKAIGLTSSELTEQQKQQIRANLILDEVPKKFGAAAESVTPLKDAFDRLKVSASNSLEAIQSGLANLITKSFIDNADLSNVATSRLNGTLSDNKKRLEDINAEIDKLIGLDSRSSIQAIQLNKLLTERTSLIKESSAALVESAGRSDEALFAALEASKAPKAAPEKLKVNSDQNKILQQRESDFTAFLLGEQLKRQNNNIQFDELRIAQTKDGQSKVNQQILLNQDRLTADETQFQINLLSIKKQFSGESVIETDRRNRAIESEEENHRQQVQLIREKGSQDIKKLADEANQSITEAARGISTALGQGFLSVVNGSLQRLGASLVKSGDAWADFGDFVLNVVGDLALQVGSLLIAFGFGVNQLAISLATFNGFAAIAAGAALLVIGGAIKALAKGPSSSQSTSGGGIANSPSPITEITPQQDIQRQDAGTSVSVVIQGDVFDSDESGSRIVSLINSAFDKKGVVINQAVLA